VSTAAQTAYDNAQKRANATQAELIKVKKEVAAAFKDDDFKEPGTTINDWAFSNYPSLQNAVAANAGAQQSLYEALVNRDGPGAVEVNRK